MNVSKKTGLKAMLPLKLVVAVILLGIHLHQCMASNATVAPRKNGTDSSDNGQLQNGTQTAEDDSKGLSTQFLVCVVLAGIVVVFGCLACFVIKKKSENQYATGGYEPQPMVGLSSKL